MIKSLALIILMIGILLINTGYLEKSVKIRIKNKYLLKYFPRTFEEEQIDPVNLKNFFSKMFFDQEPYMNRKMI
jgi:hypothetical protein